MDPLSALSLAATVVQFVDFGIKIVDTSKDVYHSADGASVQNATLETITNDLQELLKKLKGSREAQPRSPLTPDQVSLQKVADGVSGKPGKWKSIRTALLSVWSEKDIADIAERIDMYRKELSLSILVSLRESTEKLHLEQSQQFRNMDADVKLGIQAILRGQDTVSSDVRHQTDAIVGTSLQQHNKTREIMQRNQEQVLDEIHRIHSTAAVLPLGTGNNKIPKAALLDNYQEAAATKLRDELFFNEMLNRADQISDAYNETLEWIFRDPRNETRPWSNFSTWLKDPDSSIYWVNGKAGSGKSTLMYFLLAHSKTKPLLSIWANETPLVFASFFFWNSGLPLQKSKKGMLRSLLYQILSWNQSLVPIVFPGFLELDFQSSHWTTSILENALRVVLEQHLISLKLFLLIDGLDEYDGDYLEIARFFKALSEYPHVKICVSGRPLPAFDKQFKGAPGLRLEYLTFHDIQFYVTDILGNHEYIKELSNKEGQKEVDRLLLEIVEKASGVFLWVEVVVRSLLAGLTNEDELSDLWSRVNSLPLELEDLFEHMMKKINIIYRRQASQIFRIFQATLVDDVVEWEGSSKYRTFEQDKLIGRRQRLSVQGLFFASQTTQAALQLKPTSLTIDERSRQYRTVELRLKTHCAGLLEIVHSQNPRSTMPRSAYLNEYPQMEELDFRIAYIHSTAREFLEREDIWLKIIQDSKGTSNDFDPYLSLLGGTLMLIKTSPKLSSTFVIEHEELGVVYQVDVAMWYANLVDGTFCRQMVDLMDEIEKTMNIHWRSWLRVSYNIDASNVAMGGHYSECVRRYKGITENYQSMTMQVDPQSSMLTLAIQYGLESYVLAKIREYPQLLERSGKPLLDYIARPASRHELSGDNRVKISEYLFSVGCDPNQVFDGISPWQTLLLFLKFEFQFVKSKFEPFWALVLTFFVDNGADPDAVITGGDMQMDAQSVIRELLEEHDFSNSPELVQEFFKKSFEDLEHRSKQKGQEKREQPQVQESNPSVSDRQTKSKKLPFRRFLRRT